MATESNKERYYCEIEEPESEDQHGMELDWYVIDRRTETATATCGLYTDAKNICDLLNTMNDNSQYAELLKEAKEWLEEKRSDKFMLNSEQRAYSLITKLSDAFAPPPSSQNELDIPEFLKDRSGLDSAPTSQNGELVRLLKAAKKHAVEPTPSSTLKISFDTADKVIAALQQPANTELVQISRECANEMVRVSQQELVRLDHADPELRQHMAEIVRALAAIGGGGSEQ